MNIHSKFLVLLMCCALPLAASCDQAPAAQGKPFDELPAVGHGDVLAFFKALPDESLPELIRDAAKRESYYNAYVQMSENGSLADGEGPEETALKTNNAVFWSEYLEVMDDAPEKLREADEHPYANLYVYAGADPGRLFGVLKTGAFTDDGDKEDPDRFFWMDKASSKLTPAKLVFSPEYKGEDLTEDVLSTFGAPNLYYSVSNKQFYNSFHDRGFNVIIEEVGPTAVSYEWNGVEFVRCKDYKVPCIYNYGFANFMLGDDVPWTVPGFTTSTYAVQEGDASFTLVKSGAEEPALVFHASGDDKVFEIEVCSGPYCNPYGVYPGMKVSEFMELVAKINSRYDEPTYVSFNDENADFVDIYAGFDEDFVYRVPKSQYMGDEKFAPDAVIARVVVINAVG